MNTAYLLSNLYNNFITNKTDIFNKKSKIPANDIKPVEKVLDNLNFKCKNIVDDLINDRDNFENNNFKYIGNIDYFTNEST